MTPLLTKNISYLMASVQRGECQRWAIDRKMTCFGVSLDGESAFPSVDRDILVRELYSVGERGDIHQYSRNCSLLKPETTPEILSQFISDPTSMNLPNEFRISTLHPHLSELFSFSRDWCHSIVSQRSRLLKNLQH